MGNLSDVRIVLLQRKLFQGMPEGTVRGIWNACEKAASYYDADVLITFPVQEEDQCGVFPCGSSQVHVDDSGKSVRLVCDAGTFVVGLGAPVEGCSFVVCADGEPWTYDAVPANTFEFDVPHIIVRPVGQTNEGKDVRLYDGGSCAYAADGSLVCRLRDDFHEDAAAFSFGEAASVEGPCDRKLLRALVRGIRLFDDDVLGRVPWIIGLSGGLDSSVVAALLARSVGPECMRAYNLATRFNSDATKGTAAALAEALGVELRSGSIEKLVDATGAVASEFGYGASDYAGLVLENAQARIRGHLLSTFAAIEGGVVANNGNRVECALGYATLYGDAIGALCPIADLTKVQLFALARDINEVYGHQVVPEALLPVETAEGYLWETMPSAELSEGQRDPMKWFYHDWLVEKLLSTPDLDANACAVLEAYCNGSLHDEVGKWVRFYGLDDPGAFIDDLEWFIRNMRRATFKRLQAPPALRVSCLPQPACVQGPSEPSRRYSALKAQLLAAHSSNR